MHSLVEPPRQGKLPLLAALALVAACKTAAPPPPPPAAPPPPTQAAPAPKPETAPTAPQNRVALLVPLTGANAAVGQSIANAANMALLDSNDRRINLRVYDTAAEGASAAAVRAAAEGAGLFLGPLLAGDVRAAQPVASANGIPIITYSNDAALAGDGTYVLGFQPSQSIARAVGFARGRGIASFAALIPAGTYGQRASTAFLRAVEASGGRAVAVVNFGRQSAQLQAAARKVTDYDARLARAAKAPATRPDGTIAPLTARVGPVPFQALLIADTGTVAAAFGPALAQYGAPPGSVLILGTELWNSEPAVRTAAALKGAIYATVPDDRFAQLAARYRTKFGGAPSRLASLGYDSVLLVNSLAGKWPVGAPFPHAALSDPDGFAGIDGIFRFGASGVAERGLAVEQVGAGTITTVSPAPRSFRAPAPAPAAQPATTSR